MLKVLQCSRRYWLGVAMISGLVAIWCRSSSGAEILFYAPFDGSVNATVAKGDTKGQFSPPAGKVEAKPIFAQGIRGQALDTGTGCRVVYSAKGNVLNERGTITFWARRVGPKPEGRYTFHLGGWSNADGTWVLLYRWEWYAGVNMLHGRGGSGDIGLEVPADGDDGNWHFFAFTWDGNHARGYIDGLTDSRAEKLNFPPNQFVNFWVGGGDKTSRLIDELKIFDEPLSVSEVRQMYRELAGVKVEPTLVAPRRRRAVKIDGKISPDEWATAAQTTGFIGIDTNLVAQTQTRVWLLYDDKALYLGFTSELPEKARRDPALTAGITGILRQTRDRFDTDVDSDDAMEINVMPKLPNGVEQGGADAGSEWYRLVVNGLNTHYDYSVNPNNIIKLDWNPVWESASTLDMNGWHVEVRLPFQSFDVPPPKPGERWGVNFVRIWQALQSGREGWAVAPGGTPGYRYAVAPIEFGTEDTVVVQLFDWGRLTDNFVNVRAKLLNLSSKERALHVRFISDSGEFNRQSTVRIPPSADASVRFDGHIQEPATSLLTFEVADESGKRVFFRSQVPVMVKQILEIRTAHYPTAGIFKVFVDAGKLRNIPLKNLGLTLTMMNEKDKPVLPPVRLRPLPGYRCEAELNVKSLKPGQYKARCVISESSTPSPLSSVASGKVLAEKLINYEKRPLPEWYGNTIGITEKVPKPFTPVRRKADTLFVWGREYRYEGRLLPSQIVTQGHKILTAPIELVVKDASGKQFSSAAVVAKAKWGKHTDFRIEFERSCLLGKVPVQTSCWLECDGFLWIALRLLACNKTISHLAVRVPIKKEWSEYINPYDYSTVTTGKLKPEGWKGGGQPLWLGSPIGGLQFTTETLAPCRLKNGTMPVRVIPGDKTNFFELTLINTPTKLSTSFEVSWGWVATPTRPPTPGYRGWLTGNCDYMPGYQWYWPPGSDFDPRWLGYSHFVGSKERPDGKGKCTVSGGPYVVTGLCPVTVPEYQYWGDEWSPSKEGRRAEGGNGLCSVAARSWVDFFVWCYRKTYDRGRYIGLYYDCAIYYPDDNYYHGAGYRRGKTILPTNPVLAAREIAKRMYCMLRELEPNQTMILYHYSGMIDMAVLSWCDVYVDGENFTSRLNKQEQDYHRIFPVDAFLAQSMGHNFGLTVWFLDQFNRSGATNAEDWKRLGTQPVTHLYGLILLHDSTYWKAYGIPEGYKMVDEALRKYRFDERYKMIPYWNQKIVKLPEKVYATFYKDDKAKRVLMVLLNNNDEDLTLRLRLDWKALGYDDLSRLKVDDAVFHEGAKIENGELVTPIGKANMRLLAFEAGNG